MVVSDKAIKLSVAHHHQQDFLPLLFQFLYLLEENLFSEKIGYFFKHSIEDPQSFAIESTVERLRTFKTVSSGFINNNLCQKSCNSYVISGDHLVASPLPLKTLLMYTVSTGTETVAMLTDTSLTNEHLIRHCF